MAKCKVCEKSSILISSSPGVCIDCIRNDFKKAFPYIKLAHKKTREDFNLPTEPPHSKGGIKCQLCINQCRIGLGEVGFCGLRKNSDGRLTGVSVNDANLSFYYDNLPTNCVADWVCPGRTEYGYKNLAVFYNACLPGGEKLFVIINEKPTILSISELVDSYSNLGSSVKTISINPVTLKAEYAEITGVLRKNFRGRVLKITLESGRTINVTEDHPMIVIEKDGLSVLEARELKVGKYVPIVKSIPGLSSQNKAIDLITEFTKLGFEKEIMIYGAKALLYNKMGLRETLGIDKYTLDNWRRNDCLPLWAFNILDNKDLDHRKLKIAFRYSNLENRLPSVIYLDKSFVRLLGYYLAEGSCSDRNGIIEFSLGIKEKEIASEIEELVKGLFHISPKIRIGYYKGRPSSLRVIIQNKTLEVLFKEVFGIGKDSYTKNIPWFVYTMDDECVADLLDACFKGDGHIRQTVSNNRMRNSLAISYSSASQDLVLGIHLLLLKLGIPVHLRRPRGYRNIYDIFIQVRKSSRSLIKTLKTFISKEKLNRISRVCPQALASMYELYPSFLLTTKNVKIWSSRISLRRLREIRNLPPFVSKIINNDVHPLRIAKIESKRFDGEVYDLEVADKNSPYHTFATAEGIVTHNCSFNCLFCQNWHYRDSLKSQKRVSSEELASAVDRYTRCICYFGGDPTCQLPHAIKTSQVILKDKPIRICWETNGSMSGYFLNQMADISLNSGGCIKFDLKAYTKELNIALCGVSNEWTLENFARLAEFIKYREKPPFLIASTLLVPGYVDKIEVEKIARFIASLNPEIPYSLLAFYPCFYMHDLPTTSRKHAEECLEVAKSCGLKNVRIGNIRLLRNETYESI